MVPSYETPLLLRTNNFQLENFPLPIHLRACLNLNIENANSFDREVQSLDTEVHSRCEYLQVGQIKKHGGCRKSNVKPLLQRSIHCFIAEQKGTDEGIENNMYLSIRNIKI